MSARAAFSRGSLTTEMSVGGSALVAALAADEALRPKIVFTREKSWLRLLRFFIFCWIWDLFVN